MQQPTPAFSAMPTNPPPSSITTEQIQKYLDENKQLIRAILDNQNLGKLSECAQYQALLQKNLLFLAAIADAQPQPPANRPQMMPHGGMQQGGSSYMQQQQPPIFPMRPSFNPQQLQEQQLQLQHLQPQLLPFQGSMGLRPGAMNGMHAMQAEASQGAGSMQDAGSGDPESSAAADGYRSSIVERGSRKGDQAQIERVENTKS